MSRLGVSERNLKNYISREERGRERENEDATRSRHRIFLSSFWRYFSQWAVKAPRRSFCNGTESRGGRKLQSPMVVNGRQERQYGRFPVALAKSILGNWPIAPRNNNIFTSSSSSSSPMVQQLRRQPRYRAAYFWTTTSFATSRSP